jgi:hypothetical protein
MAERHRCQIECMIDEMIATGKSEQEILAAIRHEYRPYDTLPQFEEGFAAYQRDGAFRCNSYQNDTGYKAQAWDRGANAAMWYAVALRRMKPVAV